MFTISQSDYPQRGDGYATCIVYKRKRRENTPIMIGFHLHYEKIKRIGIRDNKQLLFSHACDDVERAVVVLEHLRVVAANGNVSFK